ncbi:copper resistance protein NlpE [Arenimonas oryziterrae]|uniref:Copper resistance protein NlpE n=1 Tax=Arenimonas oryziterrae DSM 21050 = YC6267 TaxID=1121015 RepID=A0A091ASB1_9GAMM|nr:copper resistance protein NlpE [Arenimonas oryziterrae]KFN42261.1 hypothetical protein N789_14350 [Arenimonas oryziterrae DSM 21050 = YC6267]
MPKRFALLVVLLVPLLVLAGCQRSAQDAGGETPAATSPPPAEVVAGEDSERLWQGVLPCSDCLGIDTRLQLRQAAGRRTYALHEVYLGGRGVNAFDQTGDWLERTVAIDGASAEVIVLDPRGRAQSFWLHDDGSLELLDTEGHPQAHGEALRLQRMAP